MSRSGEVAGTIGTPSSAGAADGAAEGVADAGAATAAGASAPFAGFLDALAAAASRVASSLARAFSSARRCLSRLACSRRSAAFAGSAGAVGRTGAGSGAAGTNTGVGAATGGCSGFTPTGFSAVRGRSIAEVWYWPPTSSRTTSPPISSITRFCIWSTMPESWVAMITVVPLALIRSSTCMIPALVSGSRLPVGSSARSTAGLLTTARAMATRCCSPPESSCGRRCSLPWRPTMASTSGTASWMKPRDLPITWRVKATLSKTDLFGSSRKSWNTTPRLRR